LTYVISFFILAQLRNDCNFPVMPFFSLVEFDPLSVVGHREDPKNFSDYACLEPLCVKIHLRVTSVNESGKINKRDKTFCTVLSQSVEGFEFCDRVVKF